eukprot:TRINITY_DN29887_c0_g1_i1.p1 TRINITY_DN29887_c0_g1~~TRINITY_DN29887_c0_g1_i1.p1  ORF type:complete len:956 (-),score=164.75 TRINITY_DN29887_c0_g1_i1:1469-4201(-)
MAAATPMLSLQTSCPLDFRVLSGVCEGVSPLGRCWPSLATPSALCSSAFQSSSTHVSSFSTCSAFSASNILNARHCSSGDLRSGWLVGGDRKESLSSSAVKERGLHESVVHEDADALASAEFFVDDDEIFDRTSNGSASSSSRDSSRIGSRSSGGGNKPIAARVGSSNSGNAQELLFGSQTRLSTGGERAAEDEEKDDEEWEEYSDEEDEEEGESAGEGDPLAVANLGLEKELEQALISRGIVRLFPIQSEVLAPTMAGRDVIARAKTGTGKTLAFGIPILDRIVKQNKQNGRWRGGPRCLIMAPTRELANQVNRELTESAPFLSALCVYGGVSIDNQIRTLRKGVDIVVGTPGRLNDLIERGALNVGDVQFLVLDEADQMLADGFEEEVERILQRMPAEKQTCLFSATMPAWVKKLSRKYLDNPLTIDLVGEDDDKLSDTIRVMSVRTPQTAKRSILVDLITVHGKGGKAIVFTATKRDADEVCASLSRTVGCEALHGDIAQAQREKTLQAFRDGRFSVLVATDVAARGLDVPNVDLVIHYEIPNDPETFVHRSGRTGRAGKAGSAILMHTEKQQRTLKLIEKDLNTTFQKISPPHADDVLRASSTQAVSMIRRVHPELTEVFLETATKLIEEDGVGALAAALAHLSGFTQPPAAKSLLTYEEGWLTLRIVRSSARNGAPLSSARQVMMALGEAHPGATNSVGKIKIISERNIDGAVFDLPEKIARELLRMQPSSGDTFDLPKELPRLIESESSSGSFGRGGRTDNYGRFSSHGGGGGRDRRSFGGGGRGGGEGWEGERSFPRRSSGGGSRSDSRGPPRRSSPFGSSRRSFSSGGSDRGGDQFDDRYEDYGADDGFSISSRGRSSRSSYGDDRGSSSRGGRGGPGGLCFVCQQPGHRAADCPTVGGSRR